MNECTLAIGEQYKSDCTTGICQKTKIIILKTIKSKAN